MYYLGAYALSYSGSIEFMSTGGCYSSSQILLAPMTVRVCTRLRVLRWGNLKHKESKTSLIMWWNICFACIVAQNQESFVCILRYDLKM